MGVANRSREGARTLTPYDELARLVGLMGYEDEGLGDGLGEHAWSKEVTPHVIVRVLLDPGTDGLGVVGAAGKHCVIEGAVVASEPMREATRISFIPLLERLEQEALSCRACLDCDRLIPGDRVNYRPRLSNHEVCDACAKLYRPCLVCGSEGRERVCDDCLRACMSRGTSPHALTPQRRVWSAILYNFSVCHAPGSVTKIARTAGTNVPTVKRVVERAAEVLEPHTGTDGVTRYRVRLTNLRG
ncbi:MAG: hypothetical protein ACJ74Q_15635 [Pyrinomonadaceae bacterium]